MILRPSWLVASASPAGHPPSVQGVAATISATATTPATTPATATAPSSANGAAAMSDDASRAFEITPLLPNEQTAVRDLLARGETVRAATRGSESDEVYLWVVTERRLLHLVHGRCQVALYRELQLRDLRRLHLRIVGQSASLDVTTRQRTYRLERLSRRQALAFAHQLGVEDVLITETVAPYVDARS